jgi:hypothetical protein
MKNLLTTSFLSLTLLGGILAQENNSNSNNGQVNDQWKINGNTADSNHFIGTKNENSLKFHTYDIERMRITSEGNVGIGIKQPQGKLDVKGNVYIRNGFLNLDYLRDSTLVSSGVLFIDSSGNVTRGGDLKSYVYGTGHNYLGAEIACAENIKNGAILHAYIQYVETCEDAGKSAGANGYNDTDETNTILTKDERQESRILTVYPNPNSGSFSFDNPFEGASQVNLFNYTGDSIFSETITSGKKDINLSLKSGFYILKLTHDADYLTTKILIK